MILRVNQDVSHVVNSHTLKLVLKHAYVKEQIETSENQILLVDVLQDMYTERSAEQLKEKMYQAKTVLLSHMIDVIHSMK